MSPFALIRFLQRYRTSKIFYFKELAQVIVGDGKFEVCRAIQQAGNSERIDVVALSPNSTGRAR